MIQSYLLLLAAVVFCGITVLPVRADLWGTNLLANPGAELGTNSPDGFSVVYVPGWQTTGELTVVSYLTGGGFPMLNDPGPTNRGVNFFAGGPQNDWSSASQWIDVSSLSTQVDTSGVACVLSGYLGGFHYQYDHAQLTAYFRDATSNTLGSVSIGPVTLDDRPFRQTGLHYREATQNLPIGTRALEVILEMTRYEGGYNDGYADNLSLILIPGHGRPELAGTNSPDGMIVSWLTNFAGFQLQTISDPTGSGQWQDVPGTPAVLGNTFVITNACTNANQFFRLKR